jgi:CheY-like chemotaxis protein
MHKIAIRMVQAFEKPILVMASPEGVSTVREVLNVLRALCTVGFIECWPSGGLVNQGRFYMVSRILIADDQPSIRRALRVELGSDPTLEVCGEAINGSDAVVKTQELRPDLIILDLAMPIMNGLAAAREIRRASPTIPILLFTFEDTPQIRIQAAKDGVRDVISKEDGIKALRVAIEIAIGREKESALVAALDNALGDHIRLRHRT